MITFQTLFGDREAADFWDDPARRGGRHPNAGKCPESTIQPLIQTVIAPGTRVHTDEYTIYNPLKDRGF